MEPSRSYFRYAVLVAIAFTQLYFFEETIAQPVLLVSQAGDMTSAQIKRLSQGVTVRILTPRASGSGAIIGRSGQVYTVVTSWHVVAFSEEYTLIAHDGQR